MEENAQAAGFSEAVVYTVYDGSHLLFKDQHPIGASQPTNLLFLVQEALATVFAGEPEEEKNRLLQQLAQAMASDEPAQTAAPSIPRKHSFFHRAVKPKIADHVQTAIKKPVMPKLPPEKVDESDSEPEVQPTRTEKQWKEPEPTIAQEPNQERGEPFRVLNEKKRRLIIGSIGRAVAFCRVPWQKHGPGFLHGIRRLIHFTKSSIKGIIQRRRAARQRKEERRTQALDVRLEREKQKTKLYEELATDRNRVRKQVEADVRREERLARELKTARHARGGHSRHQGTFAGALTLGLFLGGLWLWQHPATAHQAMESILTFKNQLFDHFGLH